jgi:hypothetical protein
MDSHNSKPEIPSCWKSNMDWRILSTGVWFGGLDDYVYIGALQECCRKCVCWTFVISRILIISHPYRRGTITRNSRNVAGMRLHQSQLFTTKKSTEWNEETHKVVEWLPTFESSRGSFYNERAKQMWVVILQLCVFLHSTLLTSWS